MLPSSRYGGRCIYCAFRAQQRVLQSQRTRQIHLQPSLHRHQQNVIRYTNRDTQPGIYAPPRSRRKQQDLKYKTPFAGRASEAGVVRKFWTPDEENVQGHGFDVILQKRLHALKKELKDAPLLQQLRSEKEDGGPPVESFNKIWARFLANLRPAEETGIVCKPVQRNDSKGALQRFREAFSSRGQHELDKKIKYEFYAHITGARFTASDIKNQQALADLRYPSEWFPATRSIHRTIHLHVGPTNSGKTYHALQRLEQAENGVYAGPLRLLAHEVYSRMNAKGIPCSLITGEERRIASAEPSNASDSASENAGMSACTVEMLPLNRTLDVAVIDEIQMIGNAERGWAWTQALLGVKAKEVHLCGEERAVPLVKEICASLGEKLEIHHYKRLSPLEVANESLDGDLRTLRKGDCIVSFSVMGIHSLRRHIERATGKKVATVYGSLPPETRAQQAKLFNDPDNDYDFLVASDAVGMGLNLAIKRMVFEASSKWDGSAHKSLSVAEIKQIAGRAGRYRVAGQDDTTQSAAVQALAAAKGDDIPGSLPATPAAENTGIVTTLQKFDFPIVRAAMSAEPEPIRTAGIFPPAPVLERFASYFPPGTPFSYILARLHELSQMHSRFHLCGLKDQVWIADLIEPIRGLTVSDRNVICSSPASGTDIELWRTLMPAYAKCIAEQAGGNIVDIEELPLEILEMDPSASKEYLRELERLHKGVVCYLWLSYRFAGVFGQRRLAFHVKGLVEEKIEWVLGRFSFSESQYQKVRLQREKAVLRDMEMAVFVSGTEGENEIEEGAVGEVQDILDEGLVQEERLREQTSTAAGGDKFGGEVDLGLEEPVVEESDEDGVEAADEHRPGAEDEMPDLATAEQFSSAEEDLAALSPKSDSQCSEAPTALGNKPEDVPAETQQQQLNPAGGRTRDDAQLSAIPTRDEMPAGQSQFDGMLAKHLAHLDVNATELERNVDSQP